MKFRTNKQGRAHPITPRSLYHAPRYKKYSEQLSGIHNNEDAQGALFTLREEFDQADRAKQLRIKRALVERTNRARVESKNKNLSFEARSEASIIADVFENGYQEMDIPPKGGTGVVITNIASNVTFHSKVTTWVNGKIVSQSQNLTKADAAKFAKLERQKTNQKFVLAEQGKKPRYFATEEKALQARGSLSSERMAKSCINNAKTGETLYPKEPSATTLKLFKKEKAAVKDEAQGVKDYKELANLAKKEGRPNAAKLFTSHAKDEHRHGKEDKLITTTKGDIPASQLTPATDANGNVIKGSYFVGDTIEFEEDKDA